MIKEYYDDSTLVTQNSKGKTWRDSIPTVGKYHPSHH
jgi:hypothetical protein